MPAISPRDRSAAEQLRAQVEGAVSAPGDADWDAARATFNLTVDQQPVAVASPRDAADVARVVRFAGERGLRVAPQFTGHGAAPLGPLNDTLLLRTTALHGVEIDRADRRARVAAGTPWSAVVEPASELGLAGLHGSSPRVGVVGYSLGGGIGWYVRKHGLSANSVIAVELVTASGELVRADAHSEPELFWALRGGGGNFGVVTAIELALHAVPEVYGGALFFPFERAAEVLHAWREWTATVPEETTSIGRLLQLPQMEMVPAPMRGRAFALVEVVHAGPADEGAALLAPLRALGAEIDSFAAQPPAGIAELHMDPPVPVPYVRGDALLEALPATAVDALLDAVGPGSGSPLVSVELRHLGGAAARRAPHHGALSGLDASFLNTAIGMHRDAASREAVEQRLDRLNAALAPFAAARRSFTFAERDAEPSALFDAETLARLRRVKAQVDPDDVIRANHDLG